MNAGSVDVKEMLEAESALGLVFAINLFVGKEPTSPSDCVTIFDTPGQPPQLSLSDQGLEYPSIQIRIRNKDYQAGWDIANDIKNILHGRGQETWNGTLYTVIYCASGPALLDWDDNSRARFVVNFNIVRR
jgi:hypothetical protein